jgi:adenine C2-methylase RlmN of 23S rRNA A2503 and tRNA A37
MIAATLISGVNDRIEDADALADFVRPMLSIAPKIALDLIPYNDIGISTLGRPSDDTICAFQVLFLYV